MFRLADANPGEDHHARLVAGTATAKYLLDDSLVLRRGNLEIFTTSSDPTRGVIRARNSETVTDQEGFGVISVIADAGATPRLRLVGVTIENGVASRAGVGATGGGLSVSGNAQVIVEHSIVQDNRARTYGGGLYVQSGGRLTVNNTIVRRNKRNSLAFCGGGQVGIGGGLAIHSTGWAEVSSSTFDSNETCRGGAIYAGGELHLENSTIRKNVAKVKGGGILFESGASGQHTVLSFNTIVENEAGVEIDIANEASYGAGLAFRGYRGGLTLYGNVVARNSMRQVDTRVRDVLKSATHDCGIEGSTPAAWVHGNFFGTAGETTNGPERSGTITLGGTAFRFSDCRPLARGSLRGRDGLRKDPKLTWVGAPPRRSSDTPQPPYYLSSSEEILGGFRLPVQNAERFACPWSDKRELARPRKHLEICDLGSVEVCQDPAMEGCE